MLADSKNLLVHIAGGSSMTLFEVEAVMKELGKQVHEDAQILFGTSSDPKLGEQLSVTIISSIAGVEEAYQRPRSSQPESVIRRREPEPEPQPVRRQEEVVDLPSPHQERQPEPVRESPRPARPRTISSNGNGAHDMEDEPRPARPRRDLAQPAQRMTSDLEDEGEDEPPRPVRRRVRVARRPGERPERPERSERPERREPNLEPPAETEDFDSIWEDSDDDEPEARAPLPARPRTRESSTAEAPPRRARTRRRRVEEQEPEIDDFADEDEDSPFQAIEAHESIPPRGTQPVQEKPQAQEASPVSRGRFDQGEPTIVDGEDLDIPTFLRKRRK